MGKCKQIFGCHNCRNEMMIFHGAIKQFLQEPAKYLNRMKEQALSMKRFIENIVSTNEEE